MLYVTAILLGGGIGRRMGSSVPKQFLPLANKPIISYSFDLFLDFPQIQEVIVVCDPIYRHFFTHPNAKFADPGKERQDSVWNAACLACLESNRFLIHDGARPFLDKPLLSDLLSVSQTHLAVAAAVPVKTTIKQASPQGIVEKTLTRSNLWDVQTPQIIESSLYKKGALLAQAQNLQLTDDVGLVELLGHPVKLVPSSYKNIKITTPEDLALAHTLHACIATN